MCRVNDAGMWLPPSENTDPAELDEECALWDWARTAGLSAVELREWLAAAIAEPQPA